MPSRELSNELLGSFLVLKEDTCHLKLTLTSDSTVQH